ncbi:hypothetical protein [Pseudomonas pohangensis]|uniref:hypothetical protein n=1 Tax=Pseudomonas pohangensis TaxID=364197 RepID=UPI000B7FE119|nr:hypothetical protein [Pseudomonas pohangensis]
MTEKSSDRQILCNSSKIGGATAINILIGLLRIKVVAVLLGSAGIGLLGPLQNLLATVSTNATICFGTIGTQQIAVAIGRAVQQGIETSRHAIFRCLALGCLPLWDMAPSINWLSAVKGLLTASILSLLQKAVGLE